MTSARMRRRASREGLALYHGEAFAAAVYARSFVAAYFAAYGHLPPWRRPPL